MRLFRALGFAVAFIILAVSVLLLLNVTAPNPTGRRYSSEIPVTTGQGSTDLIGSDAERILAADLHLPNNNDAGQRQCLCSQTQYASTTPGQCNVCLAYSAHIANFRLPDFVGDGFIADSKNVRELSVTSLNTFQQLSDMAQVARDNNLALWIFVRVNTRVDSEYRALFDGLRGGILPYFAVPGYVDPVDSAAQIGLLLALLLIAALLAWGWLTKPRPAPKPQSVQEKKPEDPLQKADEAQEFARRMKDRARGKIESNGHHH